MEFSLDNGKLTANVGDFKIDLVIQTQDTVTTITFKNNFLFLLYFACEELTGYPDPHYNAKAGLDNFGARPIRKGVYQVYINNLTLTFYQSHVPAFQQFIQKVQEEIEIMLRRNRRFKIWSATNSYISQIMDYDLSKVIETMLYVLDWEKDVVVFPWPGELPLRSNSTSEKINTWSIDRVPLSKLFAVNHTARYNIGIFSVCDGGPHYLVFVLDNVEKIAWLFDSLETDAVGAQSGFSKMMETLYPNYTIKGVCITSGCLKFEPLYNDQNLPGYHPGDYIDQNIFCHSWSLWFVYQIIIGLKSGFTIAQVVGQINNSCGTPRENLMRIKDFVIWLCEQVLEYKLEASFYIIYNPPHLSGIKYEPIIKRKILFVGAK